MNQKDTSEPDYPQLPDQDPGGWEWGSIIDMLLVALIIATIVCVFASAKLLSYGHHLKPADRRAAWILTGSIGVIVSIAVAVLWINFNR